MQTITTKDGRELYSADCDTMFECLTEAIAHGIDLRGAYIDTLEICDSGVRVEIPEGVEIGNICTSNDTGSIGEISNPERIKYWLWERQENIFQKGHSFSEVEDEIKNIYKLSIIDLPYLITQFEIGNVNGLSYDEQCGCLYATLNRWARKRGREVAFDADASSLRESLFFCIEKGDTPETNAVAKYAYDLAIQILGENE